jgi:hypothetical protein
MLDSNQTDQRLREKETTYSVSRRKNPVYRASGAQLPSSR